MEAREKIADLRSRIFEVTSENFNDLALEVYRYQYEQNDLYGRYCRAMNGTPEQVQNIYQIPYLPIAFFKTEQVKTGTWEPAAIFESSGTTGEQTSKHYVKDLNLYEESFFKGFNNFFEPPSEWCILALLPSYLERKNSSLVYMADKLIDASHHADSGFYLDEFEKLAATLKENEAAKKPALLLGVTFALLDFAEKFPMPLHHTIIMETGGMKGRKEEMTREEVHAILKKQFELAEIYSEYGMTELMSQAYSYGHGIFSGQPWLKILLRKEDDPKDVCDQNNMQGFKAKGVVNMIDLANLHSCAFIATDDLGRLFIDGRFELLGRLDNADLRGCSQLTL